MKANEIKVKWSIAERRLVGSMTPSIVHLMQLDTPNIRVIRLPVETAAVVLQNLNANPISKPRWLADSVAHSLAKAIQTSKEIFAIPVAQRLYQFKITLRHVQPSIWRRIQVKRCSLDRLHEHFQLAMGWANAHLHDFNIQGQRYGDPDLIKSDGMDDRFIDSTSTDIDDIVPSSGARMGFEYHYDFGDGWQHECWFEGCLHSTKGIQYPICLEGERACPPEDVGGPPGFQHFLECLSSADASEDDDFAGWHQDYDPNAFDPEKVTKKMRRGLPNWRLCE